MKQDSISKEIFLTESTSSVIHRRSAPWPLIVLSIIISFIFIVPFVYLTVRNVEDFEVFSSLVRSSEIIYPLLRTLSLAFSVALLASLIGIFLAWVTIRTNIRWKMFWRIICPLPLVFPSFVVATAFLSAYAPGGMIQELLIPLGFREFSRIEGFFGSLFVFIFFTFPYVYLPVAAKLSNLPPSLEETALLLGYRPLKSFRKVIWPQNFPSSRAGSLLIFLYVVSDFGVVQLMGYSTLTTKIFNTRLADTQLALALGLVIGILALLIVLTEKMLRNDNVSQINDFLGTPLVHRLGKWEPLILLSLIVTLGISLFLPLMILFWWAYRGFINDAPGFVSSSTITSLISPAINTVSISLLTAIIAVVIVLPIAFLCVRYRSITSAPIQAFVVGGFALPGLVIALSMVFLALHVPGFTFLYQTLPILLLAYVIHFGAQAYRSAEVGILSINPKLGEVSRTLGTNRFERLWKIEFPQMLPSLAAGGGLVMLSTMKELPATLLAAPINFKTLATHIWSTNEAGFLAEAGLSALVLVILSALLTWFVVIKNARHLT